ncbi:MAG TPA: Mur ligase domain-containing protein, partial [Vulgatibacter sp.]
MGNHAIFCLADVRAATSGDLAAGAPLKPLDGVTTDSRAISAGNLFVALSGENFDGHDYVGAAAAGGASAAVVRRGFTSGEALPRDF